MVALYMHNIIYIYIYIYMYMKIKLMNNYRVTCAQATHMHVALIIKILY